MNRLGGQFLGNGALREALGIGNDGDRQAVRSECWRGPECQSISPHLVPS